MEPASPPGNVYAETLAVFERLDDRSEPLTTPEVADALGSARRTVYKRLDRLAERGALRTKKVGANARVWWRSAGVGERTAVGDTGADPVESRETGLAVDVREVLERITDGFYGLDEEYRFTYVNGHAEALLDVEGAAVLGRPIDEELPLTADFEAALRRAHESQEAVFLEDYYEPLDAWYVNAVYPSASGLSVYFRDVTDRKRLERELRVERDHFRVALENSPLTTFRLDTDLRYTWIANAHGDFDPRAVLGKRDDELLPPEAAETVMAPKRAALEAGERVREEVTCDLPSGRVTYDLTIEPLRDEAGEVVGLTAASLDVTDRRDRERKLAESERRYGTLVENFPNGIVTLFDEDLRYLIAGGQLYDKLDRSPDDAVGQTLFQRGTPEEIAELEPRYRAALDGTSSSFEMEFDGRTLQFRVVPVRDEDGTVVAGMAMSQDVTHRVAREQVLARFEKAVEASGHAIYMTTHEGRITYVNPRFEALTGYSSAEVIGEHPRILRAEDPPERYYRRLWKTVRGGDVWEEEVVDRRKNGDGYYAERTIAPVVAEDGTIEQLIGVQRDVTERRKREEELAALDRLNRIVRGVTHLLIESSTREEVERAVCDRLADGESYAAAWIGHLDRRGEHVVPHAPDPDAAVPPVALSDDGAGSTTAAAIAAAVRTGDLQVTTDCGADPVFARLVGGATPPSRAVVPIAYEGRVYGVLSVYATRECAFDETERRIVGQLGAVVGHAITSIERKRALLEDRVQEITFRAAALGRRFVAALGEDALGISIEKAIPLADGETITYYSLDGADPEAFVAVVERLRDDARGHVVERAGDRSRVEIRTTGPTLASRLASHNAWLVESTVRDGECRIVVQVPHESDHRAVVDLVRAVYPDAELASQTEVVREQPGLHDVFSDLEERLTERQRTALEVGYYSGYFDWPRGVTAEELAERLGVTPPTVHHHLRHGEGKLVAAFFDAEPARTLDSN